MVEEAYAREYAASNEGMNERNRAKSRLTFALLIEHNAASYRQKSNSNMLIQLQLSWARNNSLATQVHRPVDARTAGIETRIDRFVLLQPS